ncbi:MAG: hypothetical protein Q8O51_00315 [bacterium]|nr:hypothetical protein [bacterium]
MSYRHATIVGCLAIMLAFALPNGAHATLTCPNLPSGVSASEIEKSWVRLQVGIPNITVTCTDSSDGLQKDYVKDMGQYIGGLYKYFVGVIGIIAAVMVFYGGLQWLTAGGNASRVKSAKETIFAALIAILIAFGSYTLLYTINPKLVVLNPPVLKVADTFLVSFDNTCPTTKVCLSGTNSGQACTTDAACPGASTGACGLPIIDQAGNQVTTAMCGTDYSYKQVPGLRLTSEKCAGTFCRDTTSEYLVLPSKTESCVSKKDSSNPPGLEDGECKNSQEVCTSTPWLSTSASTCSQYTVPGIAKCGFFDTSWYELLHLDQCVWRPLLVCPSGYARVGCDHIIKNNIICPLWVDASTQSTVSELAKLLLVDAQAKSELLSLVPKAKCDSTAEQVYVSDITQDKTAFQAIGCAKKYCQSGSKVGQACTYDSNCDGPLTPAGTCKPNAEPAKADLTCVSL